MEITGPPGRRTTVNALNSGARVRLADFADFADFEDFLTLPAYRQPTG